MPQSQAPVAVEAIAVSVTPEPAVSAAPEPAVVVEAVAVSATQEPAESPARATHEPAVVVEAIAVPAEPEERPSSVLESLGNVWGASMRKLSKLFERDPAEKLEGLILRLEASLDIAPPERPSDGDGEATAAGLPDARELERLEALVVRLERALP